jgi:hypothetical protein
MAPTRRRRAFFRSRISSCSTVTVHLPL